MRITDYIKTFVPILLVIFIYIISIFYFIIPSFHDQLLNQKKEAIKELTINSISLINYFNVQVEKGELDIETAKTIAKSEIGALRYGNELKDYFWIIDTTPKVIMQPCQPEIIGDDLSDYRGEDGSFLFLDIVEMVKKDGSGYVNYKWQWKDDSLRAAMKISYVHLQPEWGWIVGSGIYVNDIERGIEAINKKVFYYSIIVIGLAVLLAFYISYRSYNVGIEKSEVLETALKSQEKYKEITERKELIDELAVSQKKFETIFNSVTDGIIIFTVSGKIIEVNKTAYKRSGYTKEEYLNFPMQAFLARHPVLNFDDLVEELGGKEFISIEISYHSKEGQLINLEVMAKKIGYEDEEACIAVTREISERIEIQHQIYNAVLEAEEKERSRVAKELHDGISPILSTIKLYSQSLKDCQNDELENEILKKIEETINESIQGISDISNNLSPHILQNFGLLPALENFIEKVMDSKPIKFVLNSDMKSELGNMLDVTVYRIVTELVNNTIKYAGAKNIYIDLKENETVYLKYVDDGVGFDYNAIIKDKKGMGLFNISNRVKSLKGHIKFSPKPNEGFKMEIELPKQGNDK